jgi:hypothetical protein
MRIMTLIPVAALLASCTTAPSPATGERAAARLNQELAGLTAGPAVSCLPSYRADQMTVIDENTVLFRETPSRIWRNELQDTCSGLSSGHTLVLRSAGSSLCRGEIAEVTDLRTGVSYGSCTLGDFVPYTRT